MMLAREGGARPGKARRNLALGLALLVLSALPCTAGADGREYAIKAAFLLNFAKLVRWPAQVQPTGTAPFVLGVVAAGDSGDALLAALAGGTVNGHALVVKRISGAAEVPGCHIVFVAGDSVPDGVLSAARKNGALSVGESTGFAQRGGVINFFLEDNKVRFEINQAAAEAAGLEISSRLLQLAKLVGGSG